MSKHRPRFRTMLKDGYDHVIWTTKGQTRLKTKGVCRALLYVDFE